MSDSTTQLTQVQVSQAQKEATINALFDALWPGFIFGRRVPQSVGLTWAYYGGIRALSGVPFAIQNGTVTLTASVTNYIYADIVGSPVGWSVLSTTSMPAGWPGPLTGDKIALYEVEAGAATATDWIDYRDGGLGSDSVVSATITTQDETVPLSSTVTTLNFAGAGVTAAGAGATTTITIPGGSSTLTTQEEGSTLSTTVTTMNFVGAGVTATGAGATATVTIPSTAPVSPPAFLAPPLLKSWLVDLGGTLINLGVGVFTVTNAAAVAATNTSRTTQLSRLRANVPIALNSRALATYDNAARTIWRGNGAGLGGFTMVFLALLEEDQTNLRWITGLTSFSTFSYPSTASEPSAMLDCIVVGCDAADTNIQIMHNDGTLTCTKVDTGIARASGTLFELTLTAGTNGADVDVSLRVIGGSTFTTTITANLPTTTVGMGPACGGWQSAGLSAIGRVGLAYIGLTQPGYFT